MAGSARNRRLWLTDPKTTRFAGWAISRTPLKRYLLAQDFALRLAFVLGAVKAAALELGDHQVDELVDGSRGMNRRQHEAVSADFLEEGFHLIGDAFHRADELRQAHPGRAGGQPREASCRCHPVSGTGPHAVQLWLRAFGHIGIERNLRQIEIEMRGEDRHPGVQRHQLIVLFLQLDRVRFALANDRLCAEQDTAVIRVAADLLHAAFDLGEILRRVFGARLDRENAVGVFRCKIHPFRRSAGLQDGGAILRRVDDIQGALGFKETALCRSAGLLRRS